MSTVITNLVFALLPGQDCKAMKACLRFFLNLHNKMSLFLACIPIKHKHVNHVLQNFQVITVQFVCHDVIAQTAIVMPQTRMQYEQGYQNQLICFLE